MNIIKEQQAIYEALDEYRRWLDEIPDERFDLIPPIGGWSYAEVYSHIMQASLGSSIATEKCCRNTGTDTNKGLNVKGWLAFLFNYFPKLKNKAPEAIANLTKKISKEEARNLIIRLRKRIDETMPLLTKASSSNKIAHPLLGMLNADQWLKFTRLHLQHHIKQLNRIKKSFPHM
jgi:hypothetical protein